MGEQNHMHAEMAHKLVSTIFSANFRQFWLRLGINLRGEMQYGVCGQREWDLEPKQASLHLWPPKTDWNYDLQ